MKKKAAQSIPDRNTSQFGWWIASYIERFEWKSENRKNKNRRCLAWENTVLIQATDREEAYAKAMGIKSHFGAEWRPYGPGEGKPGRWVFEGLTSLMPIYEELADGSEILWEQHSGCLVKTIRSRVKKKHELETFID